MMTEADQLPAEPGDLAAAEIAVVVAFADNAGSIAAAVDAAHIAHCGDACCAAASLAVAAALAEQGAAVGGHAFAAA